MKCFVRNLFVFGVFAFSLNGCEGNSDNNNNQNVDKEELLKIYVKNFCTNLAPKGIVLI